MNLVATGIAIAGAVPVAPMSLMRAHKAGGRLGDAFVDVVLARLG